jgi:hypothetical protein
LLSCTFSRSLTSSLNMRAFFFFRLALLQSSPSARHLRVADGWVFVTRFDDVCSY